MSATLERPAPISRPLVAHREFPGIVSTSITTPRRTVPPTGRPRLAIGCPIFEREWCVDRWVDSIEAQDLPYEIEYHFVYTPGDDDTLGAIRHRLLTANVTVIEDDRSGYRNSERGDKTRYGLLADLRNKLVDSVRATQPDYFLSWDSDVILTPGSVRAMIDAKKPVVGALIEMMGADWMLDSHPEAAHASWMDLSHGKAERSVRRVIRPGDPPSEVGVVMAVVLFARAIFPHVHYDYHRQGEDIGLCLNLDYAHVERWVVPDARGLHLHDGPGGPPWLDRSQATPS